MHTFINHALTKQLRDLRYLSSRDCCNHFSGFENVFRELTTIRAGTAHYASQLEIRPNQLWCGRDSMLTSGRNKNRLPTQIARKLQRLISGQSRQRNGRGFLESCILRFQGNGVFRCFAIFTPGSYCSIELQVSPITNHRRDLVAIAIPLALSGRRTYTSSPTLKRVTRAPVSTTVPAQSYPSLYGNLMRS